MKIEFSYSAQGLVTASLKIPEILIQTDHGEQSALYRLAEVLDGLAEELRQRARGAVG